MNGHNTCQNLIMFIVCTCILSMSYTVYTYIHEEHRISGFALCCTKPEGARLTPDQALQCGTTISGGCGTAPGANSQNGRQGATDATSGTCWPPAGHAGTDLGG